MSLLIACFTTTLLLVHVNTSHTCSDELRRRLMTVALQHSAGNLHYAVCEGTTLALIYDSGDASVKQAIVLRDGVSGIQVQYASEPHLHHHASILSG